jgi:hypothetical protein
MPEIQMLNVAKGHAKIVLKDETPEERKELAKVFNRLLKQGHAVFLERGADTRRIVAYDESRNRWIMEPVRGKKSERVPAEGTKPVAVAPVAGG